MLARLGSSLLFGVGSIPLDPKTGIIALCTSTIEEGGGKLVWVVKHNAIESWKSDFEGLDHLLGEWTDLQTQLTSTVLSRSENAGLMAETADVQIVSAAAVPNTTTQVTLLVSHVATQPNSKSRAFLLVTLDFNSGSPEMRKTVSIKFTAVCNVDLIQISDC